MFVPVQTSVKISLMGACEEGGTNAAAPPIAYHIARREDRPVMECQVRHVGLLVDSLQHLLRWCLICCCNSILLACIA